LPSVAVGGVIAWTAVSAAISASAVVVTLILFMLQSRRRTVEARRQIRHDAISRVLSAMELTVRRQRIPLLSWMGSPELDYALVLPRLLHELDHKDEAVGQWVLRQTQSMMSAPSDRTSQAIGVATSLKLVEWDRGKVGTAWFAAQVGKPSELNTFKVTAKQRARRRSSQAGTAFVGWASLYVLYESVRRTLLQLKGF
jgi:hypothetical protein